MRLSEKLLKQMMLRGLNGQKLARLSGVSDSEISRILTGKSTPGLENAHRLSKALGVSLEYLADDSLEADPLSGTASMADREILELARELGPRLARRVLETSIDLGYEVAIRRLLGSEKPKPVEETGDSHRSPIERPQVLPRSVNTTMPYNLSGVPTPPLVALQDESVAPPRP